MYAIRSYYEFKISAGSQGQIYYLSDGETKTFDNFDIAYNTAPTEGKPTFLITGNENALKVDFPYNLNYLKMDDKSMGELTAGINDLNRRTLYRFGSNAIVLKDIHRITSYNVCYTKLLRVTLVGLTMRGTYSKHDIMSKILYPWQEGVCRSPWSMRAR